MIPVGRLVMMRATEKRDLVAYLPISPWADCACVGPTGRGTITTYLGWRWIILHETWPLGCSAFGLHWVESR